MPHGTYIYILFASISIWELEIGSFLYHLQPILVEKYFNMTLEILLFCMPIYCNASLANPSDSALRLN